MFKTRAIIISIVVLVNCNLLNAEGFLTANYNFSKNTSLQNVSNLTPDFYCFGNFSEISSINRGVSLGYIQKINNWYSMGASFGYTNNDMSFSAYDKVKIGIDGQMIDGVILSRINTNTDLYNFNCDFGIFEVYKNLFLTTSFSYTGSMKTVYNKYEELVEPVNQGVFQETQTRIRNQAEGTLRNAFESYGIAGSLRYLIPIYALDDVNVLFLAPELGYEYSFNKFYDSNYWRTKTIKIRLGLHFQI